MREAEIYDALLDAGREPPVPCPVCTGDEDAEPCGEDCAKIVTQCRRERAIRGLYACCRTALYLVREYRREPFTGSDRRVEACLKTVRIYRTSIRCLREQWASRHAA